VSTAPQGWQTPKTNWQAADIVHPSDFNRIESNLQAIELGQRTLDPSQVPSGNQGTLRQMLDWFANRIRAITGGTNWWDAPATTLAAAAAHVARTDNPHQVTAAQLGLGDVLTNLAQILDSRIVDHNLDVATAPNGRYVRLDNGLQVCYGVKTFTDLNCPVQIGTSGWYINLGLTAVVTLPAQFVNRDAYEVIPVERQWGSIFELKGLGVAFCYQDTAGRFEVYVSRFGSGVIPNTSIGWIAIGRWK